MTAAIAERAISLETMLQPGNSTHRQRVEAFVMLNLGILESLWSGVQTADAAVEQFYNAENCLFVRRELKDPACDEIMSRGVQLPDLLEILPAPSAQREFAHELDMIRTLCLKLLSRRLSPPRSRGSKNGGSKHRTK